MSKMNKKIIMGTLIVVLCSILNGFFSTLLHFQLKYGYYSLTKISITTCIISIASDEKHRMLFLCLDAVVILLITVFSFSRLGRSYESELAEITPKIKTPVKAGQNQHGSAQWLEKNEFDKAFTSNVICYKNKSINKLIQEGYEDLKFLRRGGDAEYEGKGDQEGTNTG